LRAQREEIEVEVPQKEGSITKIKLEGRHNSTHCLYKYYFQILHDQLTSLSSFLRHYKIMSSGRGWVMTPEEKAAALAEAKARGLPDGWRVELDVRPISFYLGLSTLCFNTLLQLKRIN